MNQQTETNNLTKKPRINCGDMLEYRILCNSEHFIVLNPTKKVEKTRKSTEPRKIGKLLINKK